MLFVINVSVFSPLVVWRVREPYERFPGALCILSHWRESMTSAPAGRCGHRPLHYLLKQYNKYKFISLVCRTRERHAAPGYRYNCSQSQGSCGSNSAPKGLCFPVAATTRSTNRAARQAESYTAFPRTRLPVNTALNRSPVP